MKKSYILLSVIWVMIINLYGCAFDNESVSETMQEEEVLVSEIQTTATPEHKENLLDTMDADAKREINVFLSNFSETGYGYYISNEIEEKISFAFNHNIINNYENFKVIYENGMIGISAELVDATLERFFGESIPHQTPQNSEYWIYDNGNFMMPAADGETYSQFSVATEAVSNSDGTLTVEFNVYYDPSRVHDEPNSEWYSMTNEEAAGAYQYQYSGTAVLRPKKVYNGNDSYEIVTYKVNK